MKYLLFAVLLIGCHCESQPYDPIYVNSLKKAVQRDEKLMCNLDDYATELLKWNLWDDTIDSVRPKIITRLIKNSEKLKRYYHFVNDQGSIQELDELQRRLRDLKRRLTFKPKEA